MLKREGETYYCNNEGRKEGRVKLEEKMGMRKNLKDIEKVYIKHSAY